MLTLSPEGEGRVRGLGWWAVCPLNLSKLFICGGLEMAPALPQIADNPWSRMAGGDFQP